jgi:glutamine---fructose-6-phosphate transaminase (isomerizing)
VEAVVAAGRRTNGAGPDAGCSLHAEVTARPLSILRKMQAVNLRNRCCRVCGIVGYAGPRQVQQTLLAGLEKLEYRGYDSAGISVVVNGGLECVRAVGNMRALRAEIERSQPLGSPPASARVGPRIGIGHTRWATHGRVCEANAHPHSDTHGRVHVVVNGIVENFMELRHELEAEGARFSSETDAEVIAHLISRELNGDGLAHAVRRANTGLSGHYAFVCVTSDQPDVVVGTRRDCPLLVGRGEGEQFVASAVPAFLAFTRRVQLIENGEVVAVRHDGVDFLTERGRTVSRRVEQVEADAGSAEKGGYETFMLKEIHEQPAAVTATIADRTNRQGCVEFSAVEGIDDGLLTSCRRIVIVGCGTSYHAGLIGRYALERWLRIPVEVDIASEFRYRDPVVGPGDLVIGMSQSGETADTLAGMRLARERGATVLAVTNVMGSRATIDADAVLFTRAGLEIGVAATKTFVAQVAALYLLGLRMAALRRTLPLARQRELVAGMRHIPNRIDELLANGSAEAVERVANRHQDKELFLYLGRQAGLGVCLEGALKLKEISYIATDAYAAGEMKHGPIALLGKDTPVVVVATDSPVLDKVISNIQQVRARGAHVIAVASEGNAAIAPHVDEVLRVPATDWMLQPLLAVIPLQLLAYRIARLRGLNVDQPRNLAKTVTVE